jgi:AcrR family transcriptional regulator
MRAKKTETAVRRTQIAEAALGLVHRHGFQGLNYTRLADAVGVVPSGLYRHYSDKDRIIEAVLDLIRQRLEANVTRVRRRPRTALQRLKTLLDLHVRLVLQNSFIPRVVFSEEVLAGNSHSQNMNRIVQKYLAAVEEIIKEGQSEGLVQPDIDPKAASQLFLGVIQPAVLLWTMSRGEFDIAAQSKGCWALFIRAIGSHPGVQQPATSRRNGRSSPLRKTLRSTETNFNHNPNEEEK